MRAGPARTSGDSMSAAAVKFRVGLQLGRYELIFIGQGTDSVWDAIRKLISFLSLKF